MAYSFNLTFEGVCAFVPDTDFFNGDNAKPPGEKPERLVVLLPDLREAKTAAFNQDIIRTAHFPTLIFDPDDLQEAGSTRVVDLVVREYHSRNEHCVCLLRHEVITIGIEGHHANQDFHFADTVPVDRNLPRTKEEEESVFWLPRMSVIDPKRNMAQRDLDPAEFGRLFPSSLIAAVDTESGFLHCSGFNRNIQGRLASWPFSEIDGMTPTWNRPIGNRLSLSFAELDESTQPVTLTLNRHSAGASYQKHLIFKPRLGKTSIDVEIANLEPEQLFADSGLLPEPSPDPDFEPFYSHIIGDDLNARIPNLGREHDGFGDSRKPCAPAGFSGFTP